ncbi:hypothetical protein HDE_14343 [Halotydeus destructor]|nr:hypothetical protein HDE_14343 [Halotydeus destructor]
MNMLKVVSSLLVLHSFVSLTLGHEASCHARLTNCTTLVKPYLRDVRYMFPTNVDDVEDMCKMWSGFVDCVRRYVSGCLSDDKRQSFNQAVEHSVDTVHAICSSKSVQKEYLDNAECFRKVSIENCGGYYSQLIDHVSSPKTHDHNICCAYGQFKKCVHDPLLQECGSRARNLMDHSMGFLVNRCADKEELSLVNGKCPSAFKMADEETGTGSFNDLSRARADYSHEYTTMAPDVDSALFGIPNSGSFQISTVSTLLFVFSAICLRFALVIYE